MVYIIKASSLFGTILYRDKILWNRRGVADDEPERRQLLQQPRRQRQVKQRHSHIVRDATTASVWKGARNGNLLLTVKG